MRRVLSPNFHKLISHTADRGTTSYELPYLGLLNPGQTYYWWVRARSREGVWGRWSKVFSFSTQAPAVPMETAAQFDRDTRSATLSWNPGKGGTEPVCYRVYGSAERGFTASDTAYVYHAGLDGIKQSPPNLLFETDGSQTGCELAVEFWRPFYRIAAVDSKGCESGPSAMAELAHPLILTSKLPEGSSSSLYQARVEVCASIGHLVSADENGKAYQMRFRNGDDLAFELTGAPDEVSINCESGLIAGYLPSDSAGEYEILVTVKDQRTGARDERKLTLVVK
jgi:hypothetical protein